MRILFIVACFLLMAAGLEGSSAVPVPPRSYAAEWKKIDALLAKNQTATAAPLVEAIYRQARTAQNAPAYVRALLYKIRLLQAKQQDDDEKAIALLETELRTATFPARPILHSLLAEQYSQYLARNRYRLYGRTAGATATADTAATADGGTSLATWDMARLGAAIVRHYQQSADDEPDRQLRTTLAELGGLVLGGDTEGRSLRPTLFDLLAQRAIDGLRNQELYLSRPEEQFEPTEPRLLGSAAEFAAVRLRAPAADSLNGPLHALRLLQRLTAARLPLAPANPTALADVDLSRVDFVRGLIQQNSSDEAAYDSALARLANTYRALPIGTEFVARRAELRRDSTPVAAVVLARAAEARFPKSRGAMRARLLREQLERLELTPASADAVVPGQPWRLSVTARNVTELHAWAYRINSRAAESAREHAQRNISYAQIFGRELRRPPVAAWTVPVPARSVDYRAHSLVSAAPALPVGHYLVVLSTQRERSAVPPAGHATCYAVLNASELTGLYRRAPEGGATALLVLHRQSGAPLAGVRAQATYRNYDWKLRQLLPPLVGEASQSNEAGEATLAPPAGLGATAHSALTRVQLWRGADTLLLREFGYYGYASTDQASQPEPEPTCFLFTDRAIYRPGQTVYFKGILVEQTGHTSRLLAKEKQEVELNDANGQTVQTQQFVTNEFGSFHGSFVLPAGGLNGQFTLSADDGTLEFAVEDYKRPTFFVQLDSVSGRPRSGQVVTLTGRARAYAGPGTDGAAVSYRVTRRALWRPYDYHFRGSRYAGYGGDTREVAHGTTTTDGEGRFSLTFAPPATPGSPGRRGGEPGFYFEITADVTDAAGETRTGSRGLTIGRSPLTLNLTGPAEVDRQHMPAFTLLAANATGEPLPVAGTLRLLVLRYRSQLPGVPGSVPETPDNEAPPQVVSSLPFDTRPGPVLALKAALADLPAGRYRLETRAAGPDSARAQLDFTLYDSQSTALPYATPDWFVALADTVAPGQPATVLLGSSEANARVLLEVERDGQLLRREWLTLAAGEQRRLVLASGPATARGPLVVHTTQVRDNQLYRHDATVAVAARPEALQLSLSTLRDRLQPGQRETWRLTVRQANGQPADAELLATLYDQSLDLFRPHRFAPLRPQGDGDNPPVFGWQGLFGGAEWLPVAGPTEWTSPPPVDYPQLRNAATAVGEGGGAPGAGVKMAGRLNGKVAGVQIRGLSSAAPMMMDDTKQLNEVVVVGYGTTAQKNLTASTTSIRSTGPGVDLSAVKTRSDFRETAFWEPALRTDRHGDVVLEFQMPEAVTRWQLLALAHDKSLHSGQLGRQVVTQKTVQITPNAPRFLRQGDTFIFPAKVANLSDAGMRGTAQLFLLDAATGQDITRQLLQGGAAQSVSAPAHQSAALGWEISLPTDFAPVAVTYKVVVSCSVAVAGSEVRKAKGSGKANKKRLTTFTDGEENTLPVLPNRVLLTESLPLPIVGPASRTFELRKLTSTSSATRRNHSLTLEMTANPAWYAVQSLPYLMEYPYECAEQVFSRLYANLLAAHILRSNPRLRTVLAEWTRQAQNGPAAQRTALAGKLAQNQELKNLLLQETPWVRDAQGEAERLARLTELFDTVRLRGETSRALLKLQKMQLADGGFPWFERMPDDRYITQLLVAGLGKLHRLGAFDASTDPVARPLWQAALRYLDAGLARDYADLRRQKGVRLADNHLSDLAIQALYARSFWPQQPEAAAARPAYAYYREQAAAYWPGQTRYLQAQSALALFRADKSAKAPQEIMRGLSENALHSPELGMYWKEVTGGYYWREAPTETQATLIEAYDEIDHNQKAVDELKLWLLKQKQTQHWPSTRATADACYALLLRGSDWLAPTQPLQIMVGSQLVQPPVAQAGTGYFKTTWLAADVRPAQGKVTLTKPDAGVAWGALYWQYFEDLDRVTPAASPLSLERGLYRETRTAGGPVLEKISATAPVKVGEALVVRLVLRTDRDLEYVHLKDQRAAGLEPISQVSGYRYQNGLGYYESPRDAATNFFLSAVPRGTHVFEYRLRAAQAGDFSGGLSEVQCLYAPEFVAHSQGVRLRVAR